MYQSVAVIYSIENMLCFICLVLYSFTNSAHDFALSSSKSQATLPGSSTRLVRSSSSERLSLETPWFSEVEWWRYKNVR